MNHHLRGAEWKYGTLALFHKSDVLNAQRIFAAEYEEIEQEPNSF